MEREASTNMLSNSAECSVISSSPMHRLFRRFFSTSLVTSSVALPIGEHREVDPKVLLFFVCICEDHDTR